MFGMGGRSDGPGWDGTEVRGGATSIESSVLREIRGGRPQRMSRWILRFTNGPGQRWWPPCERNIRSANSPALPHQCYAIVILYCSVSLQKDEIPYGVSLVFPLCSDCLIDTMTYTQGSKLSTSAPFAVANLQCIQAPK